MTTTQLLTPVAAERTSFVHKAFGGVRNLPRSVQIGLVIVTVMVLAAAFAPIVAPYGPNDLNFGAALQPPSLAHLMGTDENGRDLFSRCLYALRLDFLVVFFVTYVPLPFGVVVGAVAGYFGRATDSVIARFTDVIVAVPFLVLVAAVVAVVGPGMTGVLIAVPIVSWAMYARLARSEMLVMRELAYMDACVALGFSRTRTIFRHGVPNLIRSSLVYSTVDLMGNFLLLAGLSYLGLGAQPPQAELGAIIADGQSYILTAWWLATLPGLVLVIFGIGVGMIGEGLSDRRAKGALA
ncbi:ABC transporter permease [Diaminobutyricibacter sp. McL0618]|uniref:ABC transporter permease n=1 Tax=Leifsonia sp. McL0618 TaxID=3415677 RepID=UPI003CF0180A